MTLPAATWIVPPRTAWLICVGAGLVIFVLTFMSGQQSMAQPCGNLAANYAPIVAFELARSAADLQAIFGLPDAVCHNETIARMDSINWLDVLVFIPVYGAFLVSFFLGARTWNIPLARIGVKLVFIAIGADYVENLCLMRLTPALDATSVWMTVLPWATAVKWLGLATAAAVAGVILITIRPRTYLFAAIPAALVCCIALLVALAAVTRPSRFGAVLSPTIGATWLIFLFTALAQALRSTSRS